MHNRHIVENAVFDYSFDSEEDAFEQQADLDTFVKSALMPLVDEAFSEMSAEGMVFRIDRLEIDLGSMEYENFREETKQRLKERVREAVHDKLRDMEISPGLREGVITREESDLEQIVYFLEQGHLPWNAGPAEDPAIDALLLRAVRSSSARFVQLLKKSSRRDSAIKRLAVQFPDETLAEVVRILEPAESAFIEEIAGRPELFRRAADARREEAGRVRKRVWEFTLAYLLEERGSVFNKRSYLGSLIRQMAQQANIRYRDLLDSLNEVLEEIEAPSAVKKELLDLLSELAAETQAAPASPAEREPAEGELSRSQASQGWLANAFETGDVELIRERWPALLRETPVLVKEAIMRYGRLAEGRKMLADGFPEPMLKDIVYLLEPVESGFIEEVVERPELFRRAADVRQEDAGSLKKRMWEFTIAYCVEERGSAFNKRSYMGSLVRQMAQRANIRYRDLLGSLSEVLEEIGASSAMKNELLDLLGDLAAETQAGPAAPGEREPAEGEPFRREDIQGRLADAFETGDAEGIRDGWPALLREMPELVKETVMRLGRRAEARKRFADGFPETMLKDIISLLEPVESGFIEEVIERTELFSGAADMAQESAGSPEKRLWEFTIAYCVEERGSAFNKRSYMGSLIRRMAGHENIGYPELLRSLKEALEKIETPGPLKEEMLRLFGELTLETAAGPAAADRKPESASSLRSQALYEGVRSSLLHGELPVEFRKGGLKDLLDELTLEHPAVLFRIFRELRDGELPVKEVSERLSAEEIKKFIAAFLSFVAPDKRERLSGILRAIEEQAAPAGDSGPLYGSFLGRILLLQAVDLEAFEDEILLRDETGKEGRDGRNSEQVKTTGEISDARGREEKAKHADEDAEEFLARFLHKDGDVTLAGAFRLTSALESMLARRPDRLRRLLAASLESGNAADRIIDVLPEAMLIRLFSLLREADHHRVRQFADIMAEACRARGLVAGSDGIHASKWRFIFSYPFEERLLFDEEGFIRRFADYLAGQTGNADEKAFRALLSAELSLDIPPCAGEAYERIIEALSQTPSEDLPAGPALSSSVAEERREKESEKQGEKEGGRERDDEGENPEVIYIANAGLVLAAPYLPRLFTMLNLMENSAFIDREAAGRGAHLLQFMADESVESPEYQLVLNKILCGISAGLPIERAITVSEGERNTVEGLIHGMIRNWGTLGNTSIDGFRESFLQREGRLLLRGDDWCLLVEPRPYDMLLDNLPWSFSVIRHPWMERTIHVEWWDAP